MVKHNKYRFFLPLLTFFACLSMQAQTLANTTWPLEQRRPYNAKIQEVNKLAYQPLAKAQTPWRVCVLVPHLKDAYWIGIDYGLVSRAKQLGIALELFEAGSYYGKSKQLEQLDYCMTNDFDAILLGTVDPLLPTRTPINDHGDKTGQLLLNGTRRCRTNPAKFIGTRSCDGVP